MRDALVEPVQPLAKLLHILTSVLSLSIRDAW
jgi:hypothetical protein